MSKVGPWLLSKILDFSVVFLMNLVEHMLMRLLMQFVPPLDGLASTFKVFLSRAYFGCRHKRREVGICSTCRALNAFEKGDFDRRLPVFYDLSCMKSFRPPRNGHICKCLICALAPKRGDFGAKTTRRKIKGRPQLHGKQAIPSASLRCNTCLSAVAIGAHGLLKHTCSTKKRTGSNSSPPLEPEAHWCRLK